MSVTTSQRLNRDKFFPLLGTVTLTITGADLESTGSKTISSGDLTDQQIQQAVDTAAGQFVDYDANRAAIIAKINQAVTANNTFLALGPTPTAVQVRDYVIVVARELNGIAKLLLGNVNDTTGT